jgi:hypothetical protein
LRTATSAGRTASAFGELRVQGELTTLAWARRGDDRLGASRTGHRLRDLSAEVLAKADALLRHAQGTPRLAEEEVLKKGMEEKSKEFVEEGAEVYAKGR